MSGGPQAIATMIALYHFKAESEPEISMNQNDFIEMLDMDPALNGWAYARRKKDGKEGYVPISYLGTSQNKDNDHHNSNMNTSQQSNQMNRYYLFIVFIIHFLYSLLFILAQCIKCILNNN